MFSFMKDQPGTSILNGRRSQKAGTTAFTDYIIMAGLYEILAFSYTRPTVRSVFTRSNNAILRDLLTHAITTVSAEVVQRHSGSSLINLVLSGEFHATP